MCDNRGYRRDNLTFANCTCRLRLADDEDDENEDGWEDDGTAPTLNDLPKLPQVVEALKAPWQRSGAPCDLSVRYLDFAQWRAIALLCDAGVRRAFSADVCGTICHAPGIASLIPLQNFPRSKSMNFCVAASAEAASSAHESLHGMQEAQTGLWEWLQTALRAVPGTRGHPPSSTCLARPTQWARPGKIRAA